MCPALSAAVAGGLPFPKLGRVVLAAELGRFAADADTAPGLLERHHNRSTLFQRAGPGALPAPCEPARCVRHSPGGDGANKVL